MEREEIRQELARIEEREGVLAQELDGLLSQLSSSSSASSGTADAGSSAATSSALGASTPVEETRGGAGVGAAGSEEVAALARKMQAFADAFEALHSDSAKLDGQVEQCCGLANKVSAAVRSLDDTQGRVQRTLALVDDVLNLKEFSAGARRAVAEGQLVAAAEFIRRFHAIDAEAAAASEDYTAMLAIEAQVRDFGREEFNKAIAAADIDAVIQLCPTLHTLGLAMEARDQFLQFMQLHVVAPLQAEFPGPSTSASSAAAAAGPNCEYAEALSDLLNRAVGVLQSQLPQIIVGLEQVDGDAQFIRLVHSHTEQEAAKVLKRFVKKRNVKEVLHGLENDQTSLSMLARPSSAGHGDGDPDSGGDLGGSGSAGGGGLPRTPFSGRKSNAGGDTGGSMGGSGGGGGLDGGDGLDGRGRRGRHQLSDVVMDLSEIHGLLDEMALLIQYCSTYLNYLRNLAHHAFERKQSLRAQKAGATETSEPVARILPEATQLEDIVGELIGSFYCPLEHRLVTRATFIEMQRADVTDSMLNSSFVDECFFLYRRCGLRAMSTGHAVAASTVINHINNCLNSTVLEQISARASQAIDDVLQGDALMRFQGKPIVSRNAGDNQWASAAAMGFDTALETIQAASSQHLPSSLKARLRGAGGGGQQAGNGAGSGAGNDGVVADSETAHLAEECVAVFGVASSPLIPLNDIESCYSYTGRLQRDLFSAASNTFESDPHAASQITACVEDLNVTSKTFNHALKGSVDHLVAVARAHVRAVLDNGLQPSSSSSSLSSSSSSAITTESVDGGRVRFDLPDDAIAESLQMQCLAVAVTSQLEALLPSFTLGLSDPVREMFIIKLTDVVLARLEHILMSTSFRFAGAVKMEECARSIANLLNHLCDGATRKRFARLRELLAILTCDTAEDGLMLADAFVHVTQEEAASVLALRTDLRATGVRRDGAGLFATDNDG